MAALRLLLRNNVTERRVSRFIFLLPLSAAMKIGYLEVLRCLNPQRITYTLPVVRSSLLALQQNRGNLSRYHDCVHNPICGVRGSTPHSTNNVAPCICGICNRIL